MKKTTKLAMLVLTAAVLAGCKTTVETEVKVSDLLDATSKQIAGNLLVEVPACQSHEDSRQPSKLLEDVQQAVPGIFSDASTVPRLEDFATTPVAVSRNVGWEK